MLHYLLALILAAIPAYLLWMAVLAWRIRKLNLQGEDTRKQ
jgi:threonine/homoserine/homoserine lactone efflux protein